MLRGTLVGSPLRALWVSLSELEIFQNFKADRWAFNQECFGVTIKSPSQTLGELTKK